MEGTPPNIDLALLERKLMDIPGVTAVQDLHVWTVTSGFDAMSCHLVVADISKARDALQNARRVMKDNFGIDHVTIQVEDDVLRAEEAVLHV
ncbi:MAG: cation transporter, partial [Candidatus Afipia apatlaquensis]|nr:cation transporter [Candidatus Afipia apatlaquensis]